MKTALSLLAGLVAAGLVAAVLVYLLFTGAGPVPPASRDLAALDADTRAEMVDLGRYVARAGDCVACHESRDGLALAGGTAMETPMGAIYGTNITPSDSYGIGGYSADDLYRAMVYGIAPGGRHLYPAMPYTAYHAVSRADVDALWVWLMAQDPVDKPNRDPELVFPFNLRPLVAFWNLLYRPDPPEAPGPGLAAGDALEATARGHYLVDVLGHCGECHTPRNFAYAPTGTPLAGNVIEDALAPDLRPEALAARGWTRPDLKRFLAEGLAPQGVMTFRMFPVLSHSTKYLSEGDITAIVRHLAPDLPTAPADPPGAPPEAPQAVRDHPDGHRLYLGLCAGCHGPQGRGQPHGSVPMAGNTTLMLDNPLNLRRVIREGIEARRLTGYDRMQEMPGFADRLSETELEALVAYLRARWGGSRTASVARE